ncbi:MAG TPA: TDT family transporter [Pseudonocardia sp.]|uniref:TDT family transporter n=1 Tax=Pseudonocardia sp. TaxID=60912 RepID=UPI002B7A9744|nr:TDT family transporter [Pseudonocardia sp.]HTF46541.1 TDT family transporter [Pseudonocardia sp.]
MTTTAAPRPAHPLFRSGLLRDLPRPSAAFANLGPNWFASVMGTGIVANAAVTLPFQVPDLRAAATVVWLLASVLLVGLCGAWAVHWTRHRENARGHAADPVMAQFYGAPPMALLTVGTGTLLLGQGLLGGLAVELSWALWLVGTVAGLVSAVSIPYLMFTRFHLTSESAFGGWLMPIVPPMVSAASGALLVPYAAPGQARLTMLVACYAMFGLGLLASMIVTTLIWQRLTMHRVGPARMVPTLWIVLGWLGQSVTAANGLGGVAHLVLPAPYAEAFAAFGLVYGLPVFGFGLLWVAIAVAVTIRCARDGLPFSLTWWSFTFPVGTMVTGTSALAVHTGATALAWVAGIGYLGLVAAWGIVAARTARGSLRGNLFLPSALAPVAAAS